MAALDLYANFAADQTVKLRQVLAEQIRLDSIFVDALLFIEIAASLFVRQLTGKLEAVHNRYMS